jgi:hypothetical protein
VFVLLVSLSLMLRSSCSDPGFYGEGCDVKVKCPKDCSGKGNCQWGKCFCEVSIF